MKRDEVNPPPSQTRIEMGQQIRAAREWCGISLEGLADKLNLRVGFIQAMEEGRGNRFQMAN